MCQVISIQTSLTYSAMINQVGPIKTSGMPGYSKIIVAVGYESRCTFMSGVLKGDILGQGLALGFTENNALAFDSNVQWFKDANFDVVLIDDASFRTAVRNIIQDLSAMDHDEKIAVDISSMSRYRLAVIVSELSSARRDITVDFWYSLAEYVAPPTVLAPIKSIGPVLPEYSGFSPDPSSETISVVGVGYELDRALGAIEYVESTSAVVFVPKSPILEYDIAVNKTNRSLASVVSKEKWIEYGAMDIFSIYMSLESICYANSNDSVIMFPLGPKTFALASMLCGLVYPNAAVWRVSSGDRQEPVDRIASGIFSGLRVIFGEQEGAGFST